MVHLSSGILALRRGARVTLRRTRLVVRWVTARIHRMTVTQFRSIFMPAGFRRHLVGKTLRNVCYSVVTEIRFFGMLMIM